jgi:hypothetical protein
MTQQIGGGQLDLKLKKVYVLCICKYMHTYLPKKMAVLETLTSLHDAKVMVKAYHFRKMAIVNCF